MSSRVIIIEHLVFEKPMRLKTVTITKWFINYYTLYFIIV
jgi:hypothetical protein